MKQPISPLDPTVLKAYNMGVSAGIKRNKEQMVEEFAKLLSNLDTVPGIGEKTALKIAEYFMQQFESVKEEIS
ncbi:MULTISPECIES: hypothetical protein [Peribacillus]|uniref:hypothetical protein n=1 Tax=Peribacillus TaxID=2675229 RepID=UPI001F4E0843|nr:MULTISPECIES: hypothetical protein [unclassified Peribacillus]MCK1982208.1 hypothetical protein [Peribacillus sp. Aquil_B1]MCK2007440.1 hypothetical protein [Peribacillus sp. Aquil_B8]